MKDIDTLSEYSNNGKSKNVNDTQVLINSYKGAYLPLMKCYAYKFILNNNQLTNGSMYKSFELFVRNLGDSLVINGINVSIFTQEELVRIFYNYCMEQKNKNLNVK